jgi:hypothetical protein
MNPSAAERNHVTTYTSSFIVEQMRQRRLAEEAAFGMQQQMQDDCDRPEICAGVLGGANMSRNAQAAIPRALETQAVTGKRLLGDAHELLKRLEPLLTAEPEGTGAGCGETKQTCQLSQAIDRGTADMNQACGVIGSILRRLAL